MAPIPALELVTWDLDGTLYDGDLLRAEVRRRLARSVRPGRWRQARDGARALQLHRKHDRRLRAGGGAVDAEAAAFWDGPLWQAFVGHYFLPALRAIGPHPTARALVAQLQQAGVRQAVVSDHPVQAKLAALGLDHAFETGFAGTELRALKPHPHVFRTVLDQLGVPAERVLHIGDRTDTDGQAAQAAGIRFALVRGGDFVPVQAQLSRAGVF